MKNYLLFFGFGLTAIAAVACAKQEPRRQATTSPPTQETSAESGVPRASLHDKADSRDHNRPASRVPAFQTDVASLNNLRPTLPPEKFSGKQRAAYKAVKEIPRTIAQLPCYCYCDEGHGHKSLHSCFEDDHAAHCAVCIDEALLAYRLERYEKLNLKQIRERIIAQYSSQH